MAKGGSELVGGVNIGKLADQYREAVRADHVGKADILKRAILQSAAAEGATVEALTLARFSDVMG